MVPLGCPLEALEKLRKQRLRLMVVDHRLPNMSGLDLVQACKQLIPEMPIIVLTALPRPSRLFSTCASELRISSKSNHTGSDTGHMSDPSTRNGSSKLNNNSLFLLIGSSNGMN